MEILDPQRREGEQQAAGGRRAEPDQRRKGEIIIVKAEEDRGDVGAQPEEDALANDFWPASTNRKFWKIAAAM